MERTRATAERKVLVTTTTTVSTWRLAHRMQDCRCVRGCGVQVATVPPKLSDKRNALLRAIFSICGLVSTTREHHLSSDFAALKKKLISYHGPEFKTVGNYASRLFQTARRRTKAGEHSPQRCGNIASAGVATDEKKCLSIQCGSCIITHNRGLLGGYVQFTVYLLISCFENTSRAILFFLKFVTFFPERSRSSRSVDIVVPISHDVSKFSTTWYQEISYLSNQFPRTPLAERSPPTWIPSDRHRSSPWKMENVVHRIWPSGVCRTVPRSASVSAFFVHHFAPNHGVLTSDFAVSIRVPRSMKAFGCPCKMHNWQPRPLEIAPV